SLFSVLAVITSGICFGSLIWTTEQDQIMVNDQPLVLKGIKYHGFETASFSPLGLMSQSLGDILDVIKSNNLQSKYSFRWSLLEIIRTLLM
ncbi:hypothetical protein PENTCL1PPCAC_18721, partial [Pristionchus entomophagus]